MYQNESIVLLSATDLNAYLGCRHATYLDVRALAGFGEAEEETDGDETLELLKRKGLAHERCYLEKLRSEGHAIVEIDVQANIPTRAEQTLQAMRDGAEIIYQAALIDPPWQGFADFLIRVPGRSALGNHAYEAVDTKLARSAQVKHLMQLSIYSRLLAKLQGAAPERIHVVLGNQQTFTAPVAQFMHYTELACRRLNAFVGAPPSRSTAEPCGYCGYCHWQTHCGAEWQRIDHLSQVANIARTQIAKLSVAGIASMRALALTQESRVAGIQPPTLARLKQQARLQNTKRDTGKDDHELLAPEDGRGFARLPKPDPGDLFFDMEGDPLWGDGKLEYLFGFAFRDGGETVFRCFWAHSREEEKRAFEQAMDLIGARLKAHPHAHIYHYASYEQTAFNDLSTGHGTREAEVDDLLRRHKFVDLYRVVREAIRVSEPSYSIKNLETFYMKARDGAVASGGDSIVAYERWRELQDANILEQIERYNETDCRSTLLLRDWLVDLRPAGTEWFDPRREEAGEEKKKEQNEAAARRDATTAALMANAPEGEKEFRELVSQLLESHRREAKPACWKIFHRQEMSEDELIDDVECIGGLRRRGAGVPDKRSTIHTFEYPVQEFKLRDGADVLRADTHGNAGNIHMLDEARRVLELRIGNKQEPLPDALSIGPAWPLNTKVQREAIYRYADAVIRGRRKYNALTQFLKGERPRVAGIRPGERILNGETTVDTVINTIRRLENSTIVVQGPPGSGKTFSAAAAIVALLGQKQKKRVGVSSNSHKAIVTLLRAVEKEAVKQKVKFRGAKKGSNDDERVDGSIIDDVEGNRDIFEGDYDLIGGTSWLFACEELDQTLDYLFIDEAGQVSLANVVACGLSARNIVLVGDQMQLGQPTQGVHPGRSGLSALEFALGEHATVPRDFGIFLDRTRRMHTHVCRYISQAFYDARLEAEKANDRQRIVLAKGADAALKPTGIGFVEVEHADCSQKSEIEAQRLALAYNSLLKQSWIDRDGKEKPIGSDDILVVSPYNLQVDELRRQLPDNARVGTVDKFQGQEAPAVLISMASSSADDMPRGIDFLFSRNRLNVAISRARCLALVFACPRLLETPCNSVEQLRLVDSFCWAKLYAEEH